MTRHFEAETPVKCSSSTVARFLGPQLDTAPTTTTQQTMHCKENCLVLQDDVVYLARCCARFDVSRWINANQWLCQVSLLISKRY